MDPVEGVHRRLRARALRMLARREYSRAELRRALLQPSGGFGRARPSRPADDPPGEDADRASVVSPEPALVEAVLDALVRDRWLSEERAAESVVRSRAARMGHAAVARTLAQKGVDGAVAAAALAPLRQTERARAWALWQRRFGEVPTDPRLRARQQRFLLARGFDAGTIGWVFRQAGAGVTEPDTLD